MHDVFHHVLVVYDGSRASRQALADAAAIADEHAAEISVVALVDHRRRIGCARCGLAPTYWNDVMDEMAEADLAAARRILGERDPEPRLEIISGAGPNGVRRAVARLGCDLVLVPARGPLRGLLARRVRRRVTAGVVAVRAA